LGDGAEEEEEEGDEDEEEDDKGEEEATDEAPTKCEERTILARIARIYIRFSLV
jgi:hypothetical protein